VFKWKLKNKHPKHQADLIYYNPIWGILNFQSFLLYSCNIKFKHTNDKRQNTLP
jgi:hypothetical protein